MAVQKGKQGTKGKKQIVEENKETLRFYAYLIFGANGLYLVVQYMFFWNSFTTLYWFLLGMTTLVFAASHRFMAHMARATYSESNVLLDGGLDLNMNSGMSEHAKDLIILTAGVQLLTLVTNYFWLLLFLAPIRAFSLLWVNIIYPWIQQPGPEMDEKKQKKMEKKMQRKQH